MTLIVLCSFFILNHAVKAQDVHYTLYNQTPILFNPAKTGGFLGSYRIAGIYRDQYRQVAANAYKSPAFSIDAPIIKGFREFDWVGVGVSLFADRSGSLGQQWQSFKLSGAYHYAFDSDRKNVITIAYQTGGVGRNFKNLNEQSLILIDEEEKSTLIGNGGSPTEQGLKGDFTDHVGALRFVSKLNRTDEFDIGLAVSRFGKPDFSAIQSGSSSGPPTTSVRYRLDPKILIHGGVSFLASAKLRIEPSFQYQNILDSPEYEFQFQTQGVYLVNAASKIAVIGGAGFRFGGPLDAVSFMAGLQKENIKVMLAYDINLSGLTVASGGLGGFELSAIYIGRVFKRPNPDKIIFCPKF